MKRKLFTSCIIFLIVVFGAKNLLAQEAVEAASKNAFFAELLGNGIFFSVNYDYRLGNKFGLRGGIGFVGKNERFGGSGFSYSNTALTIPLGANLLLGKNGKYFEVGAGITYVKGNEGVISEEYSPITGTLNFSYRYQPLGGGVMFKIGISPIFTNDYFDPFRPGLGIGYCW